MQNYSRLRVTALAALLVIIAAGLLSGPADFGPGERSAEATNLSELTKLLASDAQAGDLFGSVAVSGDTAVVGAVFEGAEGFEAGAAYVFQRNEGGTGNWGEVTKLTASDAQAGDAFGASVAISGETVVVGAYSEESGSLVRAGAAYIFERDEGSVNNWGEVRKLIASDAQADDLFGVSVAVSGDTAVVGAFTEDAGGSRAGAAYVFQRDEGGPGNWGEVKKLIASDAQADDHFGGNVAVSGNIAVVGAYHEDDGGNNAGATYIFRRDEGGTGNWGEVKKLTASDAEANDWFGEGVAVSGDIAVVGAILEDAGGGVSANFGAAYVFQRDQGGAGNWGEVTKLTASDAQPDLLFGRGVAVSGNTVVVGAWGADAAAGTAYVFQRDQGGAENWGEMMKLLASEAMAGDFFGERVAVSNDTVVVGAVLEDAGGIDAGAAYVFQLVALKDPGSDTDGDTIPNSSDPDDDNDGCTDVAELQTAVNSQTTGGLRDPHYFWDFFDPNRDGSVSLPDFFALLQRFGAVGDAGIDPFSEPDPAPAYHTRFDRGPVIGKYPWNAGPPDGAITVTDFFTLLAQFGHSCG